MDPFWKRVKIGVGPLLAIPTLIYVERSENKFGPANRATLHGPIDFFQKFP